jgi:hypothetical protein
MIIVQVTEKNGKVKELVEGSCGRFRVYPQLNGRNHYYALDLANSIIDYSTGFGYYLMVRCSAKRYNAFMKRVS